MSYSSAVRYRAISINPPVFDVALWLPLLLLSVTLPLLGLSRSAAGDIAGELSFVYASAVYALMGLLAILILRHRHPLKMLFTAADLPLLLFFAVLIIQAVSMQSTFVALQTGVLGCAIFAIRASCFSARFQSALAISSVCLVAFAIGAFLILGPPTDRWLGGIHPNIFGTVCVGAFALSLFGPTWWRDVTLIVVLAVSVSISSRYTMVTCVLIYLLFFFFNWSAIGRIRLTITILIALVAIVSLMVDPQNSPLASALELNSSSRGLGSGASGRDVHWSYFLPQLFERPILGFGFRNRSAFFGAHNGFLNLILQIGVVGASLFFLFYLLRLTSLFRELLASPASAERGKILSILLGVSVGAQLQPQFFSFGDPFGIVAMLCLFSVNGVEIARHLPSNT